jgi:hypothetical protein
MDYSRILSSVDVDALLQKHVTIIGLGACKVAEGLAKCGVGSFSLIDFDTVSPSNIARQDFNFTDIARRKVEAVAEKLVRINPEVEVETYALNYCALSVEEHDRLFGHTDMFVFATDFFIAQARGNREVTRLRKPALFIGLYGGGRAAEVVYWFPGVTPACYRCICSIRYEAFARGQGNISSDGGTIFDLGLLHSIAGQIGLGILTPGADNRYGKLIDKLGNRNLLQTKIDPSYTLNGKDIFRKYLGDNPANFSFSTIALPMERNPNCPDCSSLYKQPVENLHG